MKTEGRKINHPSSGNQFPAAQGDGSGPQISVIIPALNEAPGLEAFLRELLRQQGSFEVIVADGGSTDGTREVVGRFPGVYWVSSPGGRGRQMNEGARRAEGEILLFLHADTVLPPGALMEIEGVLSDPSVAAGSFCLEFDHPGIFFRVLSRLSRINHRYFTYGDQTLFLGAATFREIGGYREIPVMEDAEILKRLRQVGRFVKIREPVVTSARRYLRKGLLRQHAITSGVVLLFHLGVSPRFLGRWYYGRHQRREIT